jgi:hypothetical protein
VALPEEEPADEVPEPVVVPVADVSNRALVEDWDTDPDVDGPEPPAISRQQLAAEASVRLSAR